MTDLEKKEKYPFIQLNNNGTYSFFLEKGIEIRPSESSDMKRVLKDKKVEIRYGSHEEPVLSAEVIN